MRQLINRLGLGLAGMAAFWALGMVSANEFAKSGVLMATALPGIAGLFLLIAYFRARPAWLSGAAMSILLLFFLDAAIKGFLRDYFGLRPNPVLVLQAVFNTNPAESGEFFQHNWRQVAEAAVAFVVVSALALFAERRLARAEAMRPGATLRRRGALAVGMLLASFLALHFNPTMAKENPLLFWPMRYLDYRAQTAHAQDMQANIERRMSQPAEWRVRYAGPERNTVVWVIGESINRNNMSLYGYARNTTPTLDAMRKELLVFRDVVSSEPATMSSLMKMFTPASLDDPHGWNSKPDVVMLAKEAGFKTFWISNQVPNDGWLGLVSNRADEKLFINKGSGRGENNFDGNLLPGLSASLQDPAPKKLIIVHLLGAHPTYDMRYPKEFSRFDGAADAVAAQLAGAQRSLWIRRMRNEYDNAIAYNDFVLGGMLRRLMQSAPADNASLLFSSDHAQEVGHTRDHAGQSVADASGYEIPMLLWTRSFTGKSPDEKAVLEYRPYQTDHIEHTVLGLLAIRSAYYQPERDVLSDAFEGEDFINGMRRINGAPYEPRAAIYNRAPPG